MGTFFKDAKNMTLSILTNPKRWDNLADSILGFAVAVFFGALSFHYFQDIWKSIDPSLLVLGYSFWLIVFSLVIKEMNDPQKLRKNKKRKNIIYVCLVCGTMALIFWLLTDCFLNNISLAWLKVIKFFGWSTLVSISTFYITRGILKKN